MSGFATLLVLLWIVSANYNNNLGFILTYLLAAVGLISPLHTWRQLRGIRVQTEIPQAVFAGERTQLHFQVENLSRRPKYQLRLRLPEAAVETVELALEPGERRRVTVSWQSQQRGCFPIYPLVIDTTFPLGLFRATRTVPGRAELWVYPKPADHPPPVLQRPGRNDDEERDFAGFRNYQAGDSIRQIYWKGLAKGLGLQTKLFHEIPQTANDLIFDWETLPEGNDEERLTWLCRWLLDAERDGHDYGLRLPFQTLAPAHGLFHLHACLRLLAQFPYENYSR